MPSSDRTVRLPLQVLLICGIEMHKSSKVRVEPIDWEGPLWRVLEGHFLSQVELRRPAEDELANYGLGISHHRAMVFICKFPGITLGELRKIIRVSNQALGKVLGALIKRGFVEQITDTADRRVRHLYIKDSGRAITEAALNKQFDIVRGAAQVVGGDSVRGFLALTDMMSGEYAKSIAKPLNEDSFNKHFGSLSKAAVDRRPK